MGRNTSPIWQYKDLKIEEAGAYVRLIAPCGQSRRVTPETARRIAADLIGAASNIEGAAVASLPIVMRDSSCQPNVLYLMPPDLADRWAEVARAGWENVVKVAQQALLDDTANAINEGRIYSIKNFQI